MRENRGLIRSKAEELTARAGVASISESEEGVVRICGEQTRGEVIILISTK